MPVGVNDPGDLTAQLQTLQRQVEQFRNVAYRALAGANGRGAYDPTEYVSLAGDPTAQRGPMVDRIQVPPDGGLVGIALAANFFRSAGAGVVDVGLESPSGAWGGQIYVMEGSAAAYAGAPLQATPGTLAGSALLGGLLVRRFPGGTHSLRVTYHAAGANRISVKDVTLWAIPLTG